MDGRQFVRGSGMGKGRIYYDKQSFVQLASIQSASLGLSVISIGPQLATLYGAGTAICSIMLGNLILWLVAMTVLSKFDYERANAIEYIKGYIGKYGGILAALILMVAVLNWYAHQITFSMAALSSLFQDGMCRGMAIRIGAALGLLCALLAMGGIRLLKQMTVISLPLLFCYHIYVITASDRSVPLAGTWGLSFSAVTSSVLILLPGVINFPTFFRHSQSQAHSFLALTLLAILITFFEVTTIWMDFSFSNGIVSSVMMSVFIILSLTYSNLINIYLASACWETFASRFSGPKGFAIIGLFGTLTYTFIQVSTPVQFLQDLTNAYIANLGVVLFLVYLTRIIVKHRPRSLEKSINLATWLCGCSIATLYEIQHFLKGEEALFVGATASLLFYMGVIFIEETGWAVKNRLGNSRAKKR